ncbi:hypothetical protein AAG906_022747 [Vitis piasezkii]
MYGTAWPRLCHDLYSLGLLLLLFHSLLVMLLWSYFSVVSTNLGSVPLNWKPMVDEEKGNVDQLLGSKHTSVGLGQVKQSDFVESATYLNHPGAFTALFVRDAY